MEACYEYLGCDKKDCVMFHRGADARCWEIEGTLCNHHGIEIARKKLGTRKQDACVRSGCIYYELAKIRNLV